MDIVILGAGIVGVTTAYYLAREGHSVTVLDRQPGVGLETSFANGSQIVAHGVGPWSAPGVPTNLVKWLGREDAPLLLRLRALPGLWRWGPQFLRNCTDARWRENAQAIHALAELSFAELSAVLAEEAIEYDAVKRGILVVHRDQKAFDAASAKLERNNRAGLSQSAVTREQCIAIEPALAPLGGKIKGGIYSADDQTGDCLKFTQALAAAAERKGVRFVFDCAIKSIETDHRRILAIETDRGHFRGDIFSMCLGSYSTPLARQLGVYLPIYPVKGYSATVSTTGWNDAPSVSLIDETRKIGFSRLGDRLRMAGTAEFAGFDRNLSPKRGEMLLDGLREMFPQYRQQGEAVHWTGLRPMTPDGVPLIGWAAFENLLVNAGHGTLGWSLSCGSARLISDLVAKRKALVAEQRYSPLRAAA